LGDIDTLPTGNSGFNALAKIIGEALKLQFENEKIKQLSKVSNATPCFHMSQFLKSLFYHNLVMVFLGPMSLIFLICFENIKFLKNSAFWPSS